jgi:adenylate kinase
MIVLMGLPGSGKGTQGKMLADELDMHLVSTGHLVRLYVTGERRQRMLAGELLDDQEMIDMLEKLLATIDDNKEIILDGFPRTVMQAEWLMEQVKKGRYQLSHVIHLKASEDVVRERLGLRGRLDDKQEVIEERFREYQRLTAPVVDWFKTHGAPLVEVDAERTTTEINDDLHRLLKI